jgi:O-antigen ligase
MMASDLRAMLALSGVVALAVVFSLAIAPEALWGMLAVPAMIAAAFLAWGAARGSRIAILLIVFAAVFLIDANFRNRDFADKAVDFQVLIKIGNWLLLTLVAILHMRRWLAQIVIPSNLPWLMFIIWIVLTAAVSPNPAYSAVAALSVFAYVIFSAFVFSSFERAEIFLVTIVAITLFCIVSIIVYFAVPELGRFIYWLNDQRYVSARMAGIAGSANNMGRLAAFGLVLIILNASACRRFHPLLLPISTAVLSVSLFLTNSRSAMATVLLLGAATLLLRRRKIHLLVLVMSAGLLAAVVLLPMEDSVLRLLSRSGEIDEITTVTGRSSIWSAVPRLIEGREWTGFGYASSVFVLAQHEREVGFATSHAHNIILQLLLTTGWIGVALFCLSVVSVGARAAYLADRTVLILLAFVLLNGITESSAFGTVANVCSIAFAFAVTLPPEWKNDENDRSY